MSLTSEAITIGQAAITMYVWIVAGDTNLHTEEAHRVRFIGDVQVDRAFKKDMTRTLLPKRQL